jgi:NADPH-dependent ferric siderophore reductase
MTIQPAATAPDPVPASAARPFPVSTPAPAKPRRRFRPVEVLSVRRITPRLVSVTFGGAALEGFEIVAPTQHVKLLFPAPGQEAPPLPEMGPDGLRFPDDQARPAMRTFTPRRFDAAATTLDVEFVLHDEGPASAWARQAASGQHIALAGPGGRMPLALGSGRYIVAGDESALPAIGTILDVLPASASAHVYLEVDDVTDEIALAGAADITATWLRRTPGSYGDALFDAVTDTDLSTVDGLWVACEAGAVRRIRRTLLSGRHQDPARLVTRGYWRLGEENHPDHDHGEDSA